MIVSRFIVVLLLVVALSLLVTAAIGDKYSAIASCFVGMITVCLTQDWWLK